MFTITRMKIIIFISMMIIINLLPLSASDDVTGEPDEPKAQQETVSTESILDVAYFLRRHKFLGKDVRYVKNGTVVGRNLYEKFPDPPLRSVHWQVRRNCEESLESCVRYLASVATEAVLTRENNGSFPGRNFSQSNEQCLKLLNDDNNWIQEFQSPLDKFQWLISASYFMCHYTCRNNPRLRHFGESCDNFAACAEGNDETFRNYDVRANDSVPFACAFYSFCPDPCCPNRRLTSLKECTDTPCGIKKKCEFKQESNVDFDGARQNKWNVSCDCDKKGESWSSQSGQCLDVDECAHGNHYCDGRSENCLNLPGTYSCFCAFGFMSNGKNGEKKGNCTEDLELQKYLSLLEP